MSLFINSKTETSLRQHQTDLRYNYPKFWKGLCCIHCSFLFLCMASSLLHLLVPLLVLKNDSYRLSVIILQVSLGLCWTHDWHSYSVQLVRLQVINYCVNTDKLSNEEMIVAVKRNLCNCVKKPGKNSGLQQGLNPWPCDLPVRCSTNWAMKPLTLGAG